MINQELLDRIIYDLYRVPLAPDTWPAVLTAVGAAMGGLGAQTLIWDKRTHMPLFSRIGGPFNPEAEKEYVKYYNTIDPHHALIMKTRMETPLNLTEYFDENYVKRSEFYQDFLIPNGSRHVSGIRMDQADGLYSTIAVQRSLEQGAFSEGHIRVLRYLAPHLRQAIEIFHKIRLADSMAASLRAALDSMRDGVLVVASKGQVVLMNASADRMLAEAKGLSIRGGIVACHHRADEDRLLKIIHAACLETEAFAAGGSGAIAIRQRSGPPTLLVLVAPCSPENEEALVSAPAALLVICDTKHKVKFPESLLISMFSLTPAEASLGLSLLAGATLQQAAEERQVALSTVRSQLKSIFSKTGASRQVDLVRLLGGLNR